ncbi:hypothetical protein EVAR_31025_1 [Eumeta japonica]|uniref:Uncharacterized protein n=1 Tax=Eumeta variegata TaxID=151549 RepID=A0A4C1VFG5_EUMVA|nr:hypothetical protein EVAR_31025_1 [Eumeta japonica]
MTSQMRDRTEAISSYEAVSGRKPPMCRAPPRRIASLSPCRTPLWTAAIIYHVPGLFASAHRKHFTSSSYLKSPPDIKSGSERMRCSNRGPRQLKDDKVDDPQSVSYNERGQHHHT